MSGTTLVIGHSEIDHHLLHPRLATPSLEGKLLPLFQSSGILARLLAEPLRPAGQAGLLVVVVVLGVGR
jgi:hypothetical protein